MSPLNSKYIGKSIPTVVKFLRKGMYISSIYDLIPTDVIIKKTLPGIGGTTLELRSLRNSIIVEPYLPVILSKIESLGIDEQGRYFGVYEEVTEFHIKKYVLNDKYEYKKILTTPEGFNKVINALKDLDIPYYDEYFLLFDECDRTSRDISFRENIALPLEEFFKFKNKAMISATAIKPSDPRFITNKFQYHEITPDYDHAISLKFFDTNNPKAMLKEYFDQLKQSANQQFFIFFNSVKGIVSIIEDLGLTHESAIFTSNKGRNQLKDKSGLKRNAHEMLSLANLRKYNFLTSRYFSALDINLPDDHISHVIMMSDLNRAEHTILDPYSDLIQIPGRFRNGINTLAFITNVNENILYRHKDELNNYITINRECYKQIVTFRDTSNCEIAKESFNSMLSHMPFRKFMKSDREVNYYMVDSLYEHERIKSYYSSSEKVRLCLDELNQHFLLEYTKRNFPSKSTYQNVKSIKPFGEHLREIVDTLDWILAESTEVTCDFVDKTILYNSIERNHPEILKAYRILGREMLLREGYSLRNIRAMTEEAGRTYAKSNNAVLHKFKSKFHTGQVILQKEALSIFSDIIAEHSLPFNKQLDELSEFIEFDKKKDRKGSRYLLIKSVKWN